MEQIKFSKIIGKVKGRNKRRLIKRKQDNNNKDEHLINWKLT
jgi:hypothetical protein